MDDIPEILEGMAAARILVAGDLMLDRFWYGKVDRVSPEAPVPIFRPDHVTEMLGGTGNLAANLRALGCAVRLQARGGGGVHARGLAKLLNACGIEAALYGGKDRPLPVKTRLVAGHNHLLRIDEEDVTPLDSRLVPVVADDFREALAAADIAVLSDYGKGFLSSELTPLLIAACRKAARPVLVDPKGVDWRKYAGATLVKPNLREFAMVAGRSFAPEASSFFTELEQAAHRVLAKFGIGGLLITLSEQGMLYVPAGGGRKKTIRLPTAAHEVYDVSGAGDTSLAALAAAMGAGASMVQAMRIANAAAGVAVGKLGTATVSLAELKTELFQSSISPARKILDGAALGKVIGSLKRQGKRIGFTNGCFDCCHLGHLSSLRQAKSLCDVLVVGVNSDRWIRTHKGANRPVQDEATRTQLLAALEMVDYVVVFGDETALPLVRKIRPQMIAKEGYAMADWPEGRFVESIGGQAVILKRVEGYSTSGLVAKMER